MEDLVELGRLSGAYGFRGWVRVVPFESGEVLEKVRRGVLISPSGETHFSDTAAAEKSPT